jgi:hypothetical protein
MLLDVLYLAIFISFCLLPVYVLVSIIRFAIWMRRRSARVTSNRRSHVELPASTVTESCTSHRRENRQDEQA